MAGGGFEGLLGDLVKAMGAGGASAWFEAARSLAVSVVADDEEARNPDPVQRIRLEELARIVTRHVDELVGSSRDVEVVPATRAAWALAALDSWRPRLEPLAAASAAAAPPAFAAGDDEDDTTAAMLGRLAAAMGPMFLGMQVGSTAGHLAERALGTSAFPLPWPASHGPLVVQRNLAQFADDWSLDPEHVAAFTVARELVAFEVLTRPSIAERLESLLAEATTAQMAAQRSVLERLTQAESSEDLTSMLADPERFLEGLTGLEDVSGGPASDALNAAVTALGAYFDAVARTIATRMLGDASQLAEAWRRHRTGDSKGDQAAAALFGVDLSKERVDLGSAFIDGVVERAGADALARLAADATGLPTPPEIVAPGLWLARTSLGELGDPGDAER